MFNLLAQLINLIIAQVKIPINFFPSFFFYPSIHPSICQSIKKITLIFSLILLAQPLDILEKRIKKCYNSMMGFLRFRMRVFGFIFIGRTNDKLAALVIRYHYPCSHTTNQFDFSTEIPFLINSFKSSLSSSLIFQINKQSHPPGVTH